MTYLGNTSINGQDFKAVLLAGHPTAVDGEMKGAAPLTQEQARQTRAAGERIAPQLS